MELRTCFPEVLISLLYVGLSLGVPIPLFFPYGEDRLDKALAKGDDVSSNEIQLTTPIAFYDGLYSSIFVNANGHLSFETEVRGYQSTLVLPINLKVIAAFLADIDIRGPESNVFYRETQEKALLQRAAADVQTHFSQFPTFDPTSLFIATWDKVGAYNQNFNNTNTFQIVIASDGLDSFAMFLYLDDGITWLQADPKTGRNPPAQAGFDSGQGRLHVKLPNSGTLDAGRFAKESNVNVPGVWIYQIGNLKGGNVVGPDLNTGDVVIFEPTVVETTCIEGARKCSDNARCIDFDVGFCCECIPPYYGNGYQCLETGNPQRLNGKVSGTLNGVRFEDLDMHSFVVTKDGRTYTAISRVPAEIGPIMLTLNTIGGIIGWIFAVPSAVGALNGYSFTGGEFNRTATITYPNGESVTIRQRFYGADALDQLRMDTVVDGTVPVLTGEMAITVDDYKEEYRRVAPGQIRSRSDRTYRVNQIANRYSWDQIITYKECPHDTDRRGYDTMRLTVSRNYVVYDPNDQVVRFAMSNQIGILTGSDPCRDSAVTCGENSDCVPSDGSYRCVCRTGFSWDGIACTDLDECSSDLNTCDVNARCTNVPGSFVCQCYPGYRGDGRTCTRDVQLCGSSVCDVNARCVYNDVEGRPVCECKSGYQGDGLGCRPISFGCNEVDICNENAECVYNPETREYECVCVEGYSGDGVDCDPYVRNCSYCDQNAECRFDASRLYYQCVCRDGYRGNGLICIEEERIPLECEDCHADARCLQDPATRRYFCQCLPGFEGNGYVCTSTDCRSQQNCDPNAECVPDTYSGTYQCRCRSGYRGDGLRCVPEGCNVVNNCDPNAQCIPDPRDTSRYICRCNRGYEGNGISCVPIVVPCNEVDNCSPNAECLYDPNALSYRCRCGRGYEGDGYTCRPRGLDCRRDPRICDPNAACVLNVDTFVCVCNQNYRGDGLTCIPVSGDLNYLLFSRGRSIGRVPHRVTDSDRGERILYVADELAIALDGDCQDQMFYWSDINYGRIRKANLDGSGIETVLEGFSSPEGIAVDWLSRNMYITDSALDVIVVANIDGTYRKTLFDTDLENPRAIVVDPQRGAMYWTDWNRGDPAIEKAFMDGTSRQVFVDTDLGLPNGLTIDYTTQQLCWGDAGVRRIECIRSDGVGRTVITEDAPYPFSLVFFGNNIYWTDWRINGIPSISRNGGEQNEILPLPVGGYGRLYGLTAIRESCPRVTNSCQRNNGGCRFLCLPTPSGGRTCVCPDDIDQERCNEIAVIKKKKK